MRKRYFVIHSQVLTELFNEPNFWSNKYGWTSLHEATVFTGPETQKFRLPDLSAQGAKNPEPYWMELPVCMMKDPNWDDEEVKGGTEDGD